VTNSPETLATPSPDAAALDAYSQAVSTVARVVMPSVVNLVLDSGRANRRVGGAGSGVAITPDGYLLTSAHVVARARTGTASFADGRELRFTVTGSDPLSDLAVIHVDVPRDAPSLHPATLGDAERLVVGQLVVAVGNPLGFTGSVSAGVVSGLGRSMATQAGPVQRIIDDVIQTDAALHPGNSGGALAITNGEVVGINTAVVGPGIGQGLGLAVPINTATRLIIGTLMRDGRVRRAYLGLAGGARALAPTAARRANQAHGVEVTSVVAGSPADAAGLRPGDIVLRLDGVATQTVSDVQRLMTTQRIGQAVEMQVWRENRVTTLTIRPTDLGN
jgi:S1-C subfamily serine protease